MGQVIKCNKKSLKTDIGDVDRAIQKIDKEIDDIRSLLNRLSTMWDGEAADIFEKRAAEHLRELEDLSKMLNRILLYENSAHIAYTNCENKVERIIAAINV